MLIRAEGWKTCSPGHHEAVIAGLHYFIGNDAFDLSDYFNKCRRTREAIEYSGETFRTSEIEVKELFDAVHDLEDMVMEWLKKNHPDLIS